MAEDDDRQCLGFCGPRSGVMPHRPIGDHLGDASVPGEIAERCIGAFVAHGASMVPGVVREIPRFGYESANALAYRALLGQS